MVFCATVAFGFRMEIAVFDVDAHGQAHVGLSGEVPGAVLHTDRAAEMKQGRVALFKHLSAQLDFHRAAIARISHKVPNGGRTRLKSSEAREIKRRDETIGVDPNANALGENVAIHRQSRMQIRTEQAIVFGLDAAKVNAKAGHTAAAVGQKDQVGGVRNAESAFAWLRRDRCGMRSFGGGSKKTNGPLDVLVLFGVRLEN